MKPETNWMADVIGAIIGAAIVIATLAGLSGLAVMAVRFLLMQLGGI